MVGAMLPLLVCEVQMPRKNQEMQSLARRYREETGHESLDTHDLARWAINKGWPLPKPKSAIDRLAEQFSVALREEMRRDEATGKPYRANLAVTTWQNGQQMTLWADIDKAPRSFAQKAFVQRREQMVGDGVQLTFDVLHWNRINEGQELIEMPMDFTDDVQWRMNAPDDNADAAAA